MSVYRVKCLPMPCVQQPIVATAIRFGDCHGLTSPPRETTVRQSFPRTSLFRLSPRALLRQGLKLPNGHEARAEEDKLPCSFQLLIQNGIDYLPGQGQDYIT